ncbi:trans-aconitate 2-methyltransferase [Klebsiella quasipneumoniae]|nr:trans-aconitate 2-methyltransferase [Klebsiella quasipneumoniae]
MADWNPSLYLQFDAERTRPAADLLSRIAHLQVESVVDLGCGPGNSTRLLRAAWPLAAIVGIDNSPAMLDQATQALPDCEFIEADIASWRPAQPPDVIYANASLQWLADHETLFPHLVNQLAVNGTLAVQMPDNWQEPSHTLMRQVAGELGLPDRGRQPCFRRTPGTICSPVRAVKLISGAPPIFIRSLPIRQSSTGCRAPDCDLI